MFSTDNGLVVGSKRWLACQFMKEFRCWASTQQPDGYYSVTWECPVCNAWRHTGSSGILLIGHLQSKHTTKELKDAWLSQTLAGK